jgi:hypothetical protein
MSAERHKYFRRVALILVAAVVGLPQGDSAFKPSRLNTVALVGFETSATTQVNPWAIIRNEATREEEIFELGDTVFTTGKLVRISRVGVDIMGPQAKLLRLSLAGQEYAVKDEDLQDLEGNDLFGDSAEVEVRPALVASEFPATFAAAMVAQGALATQGSFHTKTVAGQKQYGVRYEQIPPGSLFDTFGVKPGDFVYAINRREVIRESDIFDIDNYIRENNQRAISLRVVREGRPMVLRTLLNE